VAGLVGFNAHGLRKAAARRLAEAGPSRPSIGASIEMAHRMVPQDRQIEARTSTYVTHSPASALAVVNKSALSEFR